MRWMLLLDLTLLAAAAGTITRLQADPSTTTDDWPTYLRDAGRSAASGDTTLSPANAGQLSKL